MKKIYKKYMIRPIIYQIIPRFCIGAAFCLLWDRYLNKAHYYNIWEYPTLLYGFILLALAWFQYLKLDGFRIHYLMEHHEKKTPKKHHSTRSIVDFADEKIISFDELEPSEQAACRLASNLIPGIIFILPSLLLLIISS